ncbi:MAG: TonB family protein [Pyrinomonadaceae bacterium]
MRSLPFKKLLSVSLLAIFLSAFAAVAVAQNPPLSLADLLIGLRSKKATIEERNQILATAVKERGITFVFTPEIEKELVATGANADLVAAVRLKSQPVKPAATPKPVATPVPTPTPPDSTFYLNRAEASLAKGELDSALADYDKAAELKADDPGIYVGRAKAHFGKKAYDLSVKDYDKAIELSPKTTVAFLNRGASYEKLGDPKKALADYKKAAELEPANELAKAAAKRIEDQLAKEEADRLAAQKATEVVPEFINLGNLSSANAERLVTPTYSTMARQSRITGRVTVEVVLNEQGEVVSADATSGHAMLRQSAEDAALRSKFKPAEFNGKPIKAKGVIIYNFSL